jgi:sucrose phosphorylase
MNINYFDALSDPRGGEPIETQAARFLVAQAIMLALIGLPGIYFHSLFGSRGWPEGVAQTGRARTINRQKLDRAVLEAELSDPLSLHARVFEGYTRLLRSRAASAAFDPYGSQEVVDCGEAVFALRRTSPDGADSVLCLHNVTSAPQQVALPALAFSADLLTGDAGCGERNLTLAPYQVAWLRISAGA